MTGEVVASHRYNTLKRLGFSRSAGPRPAPGARPFERHVMLVKPSRNRWLEARRIDFRATGMTKGPARPIKRLLGFQVEFWLRLWNLRLGHSRAAPTNDIELHGPNLLTERASSTSSGKRRVEAGKSFLPPIREMRIGRGDGAGRVEFFDLLFRQRPVDRAEILAKLLLVAGADDDR